MIVRIENTGTVPGYEDYHNDYFVDDELVAQSNWDKNQSLHVGVILNRETHRKNLYAGSPEGIARKIEKLLPTSSVGDENK